MFVVVRCVGKKETRCVPRRHCIFVFSGRTGWWIGLVGSASWPEKELSNVLDAGLYELLLIV